MVGSINPYRTGPQTYPVFQKLSVTSSNSTAPIKTVAVEAMPPEKGSGQSRSFVQPLSTSSKHFFPLFLCLTYAYNLIYCLTSFQIWNVSFCNTALLSFTVSRLPSDGGSEVTEARDVDLSNQCRPRNGPNGPLWSNLPQICHLRSSQNLVPQETLLKGLNLVGLLTKWFILHYVFFLCFFFFWKNI